MKKDKIEIKSYFNTGDKPTQEQYHDTWDSFWHKDETIPAKSLLTASGRILLKSNLNWTTNADDNYGINLHNAGHDCGAGDNPTYDWVQLGTVVPSGYRVNNVTIVGRVNGSDVDDVRFQFVKRIKNVQEDWQDVNDNLDFTNTVLYDNMWMQNTEQSIYSGIISRKAKRVFETKENNLFDEDGELFMYLKPIGTFSEDRYFQFTLSIEIEKA